MHLPVLNGVGKVRKQVEDGRFDIRCEDYNKMKLVR